MLPEKERVRTIRSLAVQSFRNKQKTNEIVNKIIEEIDHSYAPNIEEIQNSIETKIVNSQKSFLGNLEEWFGITGLKEMYLEGAMNQISALKIDTITDLENVPIIGRAAADTSEFTKTEFLQDIIGRIDLPETLKAVEIQGDSMAPVVLSGQYALISSQDDKPLANSIVVAEIKERDGVALEAPEYYCKRAIVTDGTAYLSSQNPTTKTPMFSSNRFRLWPVVGVWFGGKGKAPAE